MIEVKDISKRYGDGTVALGGVSFSIDKKITSIIGKNGAGKTTLLRILSTQLAPSSGTALINSHDLIKNADEIRKMIVSVPQEAKPIQYISASDFVRMYLSARGFGISEAKAAAEKALRKVGLWEFRDKLTAELSGGMKRKVFVATALASDADVIFLDEPTTGLDPFSRIEIWHAIKALRGQVILTTHYMEEAQALSDDVIMMDRGKILSKGSVNELLKGFDGLVRVEGRKRRKMAYKVGDVYVSYVDRRKAAKFINEGEIIRPIMLDDLFIKRGVNLES